MSEKALTKAIRDLLKSLGIWHWKNHGGPMGAKGVADILGCYGGRMLAIEVKTDRGRLSDDQQRFLDNVNAAGGIAFVAKSVDDVIVALGLQDRFLNFI
jgi:Holliday junction resolvase